MFALVSVVKHANSFQFYLDFRQIFFGRVLENFAATHFNQSFKKSHIILYKHTKGGKILSIIHLSGATKLCTNRD